MQNTQIIQNESQTATKRGLTMRIFATPREVASFMQNAEGEVTVRKNKIFFNGELIGEFHFQKKAK